MNLNKLRNINYKIARFLGDINAIQKGRTGKRVLRRIIGRLIGKFMRRLLG